MSDSAASIRWTFACRRDDVVPNTGACVLLGGQQIALFRVVDPHCDSERFYAIGNVDPFSRAAVLARGLVGGTPEAPYVASPMYKQRFDLRTGVCLDDTTKAVPSYPVRCAEDWLLVGAVEHAT